MTLTFDTAARALDDAAQEAPDVLAEEIRAGAAEVVDAVVEGWPVKTGTSAAGWRDVDLPRGAQIRNDVEYTSDVQGGLADELVPFEIGLLDDELLDRIESTITPIFEG